MFVSALGILYYGHKRGTYNVVLWAGFPFIRGLHWLSEYLSDLGDIMEMSEELFIFERLEIIFVFGSTLVLLAACMEFNGLVPNPLGKLAALLASFPLVYYFLLLPEEVIDGIEDTLFFRGFVITSDPNRFLYGFLLPVISAMTILGVYVYRYYQARKGIVTLDKKLKSTALVSASLIFIFSIFEGFDFESAQSVLNDLFIGLRSLTLIVFIVVPVVVILSTDMGLQNFLIIENTGHPLLAYDFKNKAMTTDGKTILMAGFLAAIVSFSRSVSEKDNHFTIRSNNLYYGILKTDTMIYALQSVLYKKTLETHFIKASQKIDNLIASASIPSEVEKSGVISLLEESFSEY
jgi:hypothetical protein